LVRTASHLIGICIVLPIILPTAKRTDLKLTQGTKHWIPHNMGRRISPHWTVRSQPSPSGQSYKPQKIDGVPKNFSSWSIHYHLVAIRMLFDWMVTGQELPTVQASAVNGSTVVA
jgi:hypothetical protein